jgi:hypothetical protein
MQTKIRLQQQQLTWFKLCHISHLPHAAVRFKLFRRATKSKPSTEARQEHRNPTQTPRFLHKTMKAWQLPGFSSTVSTTSHMQQIAGAY